MPALFEFPHEEGKAPIHVLVVVVGKYVAKSRNLSGAGLLAQDIVNFWHSKDRIFPSGQALASVEVLLSDPDTATQIVSASKQGLPTAPTLPAIKTAMTEWAGRISTEGNAVGVLHWVGHGFETTQNGDAMVLACEGTFSDGTTQDGLDWSRALHWLNAKTNGHPVYCFIDACRTIKPASALYDGLGPCLLDMSDNAVVFTSTQPNKKAFWIVKTAGAAAKAGCRGQALGTRAFLEALESFGARQSTQAPQGMPIISGTLLEAAHHLIARWGKHQNLQPGQPRTSKTTYAPILLTNKPKSIVDVIVRRKKDPGSCVSRPDPAAIQVGAETDRAPFEFRLSRKSHSFKLGADPWGPQLVMEHPYVSIVDGLEHC